MKKALIAGVLLIIGGLGLGWSMTAHAQNNVQTGNNVTVPRGETIDQTLFAAGQTIDVAGTVNGDVLCAGQTITVSGTVNGDVLCGGQNLNITGTVNGSVRVAGQAVTISGKVSKNVTAAGQTVTLESAGTVGGDVSIGGQSATVNGMVGRDLAVAGTAINIGGHIVRDTQAGATHVTLASTALIGGNLTYTSVNKLTVDNGARVVGMTTQKQPPAHENNGLSAMQFVHAGFWFWFYMFVSLLLVALVLVLLFPSVFHTATNVAVDAPFRTLLVGFIASIVAPIVIFIVFVTVIGIPLALLLLLIWIVVDCLAVPFAAYYLGRMILRRSTNPVWMMLLGSAIILVLYFIPFIGFLVWLVAMWLGLGIIVSHIRAVPRPNYNVAR